jgi:hypothetical protein
MVIQAALPDPPWSIRRVCRRGQLKTTILEWVTARIETAWNFKLDRRSRRVREFLETRSNRFEHVRDLGILFKPCLGKQLGSPGAVLIGCHGYDSR